MSDRVELTFAVAFYGLFAFVVGYVFGWLGIGSKLPVIEDILMDILMRAS